MKRILVTLMVLAFAFAVIGCSDDIRNDIKSIKNDVAVRGEVQKDKDGNPMKDANGNLIYKMITVQSGLDNKADKAELKTLSGRVTQVENGTYTYSPADDVEEGDVGLCGKLIFSNDNNPRLGCVYAAKFDQTMPAHWTGTRDKIAKWTDEQFAAYNTTLLALVKRYTGRTYDFVLTAEDVEAMDADGVVTYHNYAATRGDLIAVDRPRGTSKKLTDLEKKVNACCGTGGTEIE